MRSLDVTGGQRQTITRHCPVRNHPAVRQTHVPNSVMCLHPSTAESACCGMDIWLWAFAWLLGIVVMAAIVIQRCHGRPRADQHQVLLFPKSPAQRRTERTLAMAYYINAHDAASTDIWIGRTRPKPQTFLTVGRLKRPTQDPT